MNRRQPFVKATGFPSSWGDAGAVPADYQSAYNPGQGYNISAQVGSLTPPIIGAPGVINSIGGRDFLSIDVTQEYLPYINQASYMRKHLRVVPMDGPSRYIPKIAGPAKVYATGEGLVMSQAVLPTTSVALIAKAMAVSFAIPREIADDSIINLLPAIRDHLVDRFVLAEEEAFLLGDSNTFNGTGSVRSLFDGLSVGGEYDPNGSDDVMANNGAPLINAAGNPFSTEHVNEAIEKMDLLGQNPDHILGIVSRKHARTIRGDSTLLRTLTNFGPSPTFRTGRIGQIFGINLVQTNLLNANISIPSDDGQAWAFLGFGSETPGEYHGYGTSPGDGTLEDTLADYGNGNRIYAPFATEALAKASATTLTEAIFVHKDAAVIGDRQQLEIEMSAHTLLVARSLLMVCHTRLAFCLQLRKGILKVVQLS
jgi:hypothetical protein